VSANNNTALVGLEVVVISVNTHRLTKTTCVLPVRH